MLLNESRILPYAIITLALVVFIWILTHQMDEAPVLVINPSTRVQNGWTAVSDKDRSYAINLPREWAVEDDLVDEYAPLNTAVFETMAQFSESDPNLEIKTVAYSQQKDDNVPVMAVVLFQSERLNGINVDELAVFIAENEEHFKKVSIVNRPWHISQLHLTTDNSDRTLAYVCELRYAPSEVGDASFITVCAARTAYAINRNIISTLIESYQEIQ